MNPQQIFVSPNSLAGFNVQQNVVETEQVSTPLVSTQGNTTVNPSNSVPSAGTESSVHTARLAHVDSSTRRTVRVRWTNEGATDIQDFPLVAGYMGFSSSFKKPADLKFDILNARVVNSGFYYVGQAAYNDNTASPQLFADLEYWYSFFSHIAARWSRVTMKTDNLENVLGNEVRQYTWDKFSENEAAFMYLDDGFDSSKYSTSTSVYKHTLRQAGLLFIGSLHALTLDVLKGNSYIEMEIEFSELADSALLTPLK